MPTDESYRQELLTTWEETYKKGQLTFWLLLTLRDDPRYVTDIRETIRSLTNGTIECEDQSVYRALRKFRNLEIVDYELRDGNRGPERKYYFLTKLGNELLQEFIDRNISILYNERLTSLLFTEGTGS